MQFLYQLSNYWFSRKTSHHKFKSKCRHNHKIKKTWPYFKMEKKAHGSWKVLKYSRPQKRIEIVADGEMVAVDQLAFWGFDPRSSQNCAGLLPSDQVTLKPSFVSLFTQAPLGFFCDVHWPRHPWRLPVPVISVWRNIHETAPQRKTWPRISRWRFQWYGPFLRYRHAACETALTQDDGSQTRQWNQLLM